MPGSQPRKFFIFFLLTLCLFSSAVNAEETPRLEGIVEDPSNGADSIAVISGRPVKAGDSVGPYRVDKIFTDQVTLHHSQTQKETVLYLKEEVPSPAKPAASAAPEAPRTLIDQAKSYLNDPSKAVNRVWELKALRDLAIINNAAVKYYGKNQFFPVRMRQLTLDGYLPQEYEKGIVNKYQFYFKNTPMKPDDLRLHADPLEKTGGYRSFFVGPDAVIRESSGSPAQADNLPHDYPGKKT